MSEYNRPITCYTCQHYHAVLGDYGSNWHIHDYCDFWKSTIPNRADSDNLFDDVDKEIAYCWGYDKKES